MTSRTCRNGYLPPNYVDDPRKVSRKRKSSPPHVERDAAYGSVTEELVSIPMQTGTRKASKSQVALQSQFHKGGGAREESVDDINYWHRWYKEREEASKGEEDEEQGGGMQIDDDE